MLPTRFVPGQAPRKSRLGDRQSFLPRRVGSTDRLSDPRRPSGAGARSSSADTARSSVRLSREASASKVPMKQRSRSQQADARQTVTPLRSNQFSRPTTTPVRTPSGDRFRSWETSLDRALAFVTVKDQRAIANTAWQRSTLARVQEALAARGEAAAIIRPLTIARFVEIVGALLHAVTQDDQLSTDNYVTKLPHTCKRLLYPGTVSKSWLKAVNTLHAFPQALALIAYLLDLLQRIECEVSDDWLYVENDELSRLRRDYLRECFFRFQKPNPVFDELTEDYLQRLKVLLGTDDEKIRELQEVIKLHEQALSEEREATAEARACEAARAARRDALQHSLRNARRTQAAARAELQAARAAARDRAAELRARHADVDRAAAETEALKRSLETQEMSVEERARLLDHVDYATRVHDSKRVLAEQIAKMVHSKETELALWQKKTLDSCVEYKQGLIHLTAQFPDLAALAIDETKLMEPGCAAPAAAALEALRTLAGRLAQRRQQLTRTRSAIAKQRRTQLEEARAAIAELKASLQQTLEGEARLAAAEAAAESAAAAREAHVVTKLEAYKRSQEEFQRVQEELAFWKKQDDSWRAKLAEMREYIRSQKENLPSALQEAYKARVEVVAENLQQWNLGTENSV